MHIKIVKAGKYEYVRLVESFRENGKVKHKVILNFVCCKIKMDRVAK